MSDKAIVVTGLDELIKRMDAFPVEMGKAGAIAMSAAINTLWENVPPYPEPRQFRRVPSGSSLASRGARPVGGISGEVWASSYRRTGTLGRSLGSDEGGGAQGGSPDIYTVRKLGGGNLEGKFGSRLNYAPYVIGDGTQASVHSGRWWTMNTILQNSQSKIINIFQRLGDELARFLDGK